MATYSQILKNSYSKKPSTNKVQARKLSREDTESYLNFCEEFAYSKFTGDINNYIQVQHYLDENLEYAEHEYRERLCEYESYLYDLMYN